MLAPIIPGEVPGAWQAYGPIIAGVVRALLAAAGAAGFTWAQAVSGDQIEMTVGAALVLGSAFWSAWQKIADIRAARRLATAAAVQSAVATHQAGQPVPVIPASPPGTTALDLNKAELQRIQQGV